MRGVAAILIGVVGVGCDGPMAASPVDSNSPVNSPVVELNRRPDPLPTVDPTTAGPPDSLRPALVVGRRSDTGMVPVAPGEPIEIVQGPQGGIHVEVLFELEPDTGSTLDAVKPSVTAALYAPCASTESAAGFRRDDYLLLPQTEGPYRSGVIPVIFDANDATPWAGNECCVEMEVALDTRTYRTTAQFLCVDEE